MIRITIQQGIFLVSTLSEKENRLLLEMSKYRVPLSVNDKYVPNIEQAEKMLEAINTLKLVQRDIVSVKVALAKANIEVKSDGKSINELLEEVRVKRRYLSYVKNIFTTRDIRIENTIGVVQYGILNEKTAFKEVEDLQKEINEISQKIDILNSSNYIEVELLSE